MSEQGAGGSSFHRTLNRPDVPTSAEDDARWSLVLRIAGSRQFTKASQLHDILIYICQRALADSATTIKEYEIGCNALGRKPDFNPNEDNIVRVQISHLRKKLDEYFATDGKDEPLLITVPKGAYLPRFAPRLEMVVASESSPPKVDPAPALAAPRRSSKWILLLPLATCLLAAANLYQWLRPLAARPGSQTLAQDVARQDPFWSRIFVAAQPAGIVVADSCLVILQDVLHTDLSLDSYLGRGYPEDLLNKVPDRDLRAALRLISARQYTSLADLNIASRLAELSREFGPNRAPIRFARHLNIRDFKTQNFVLIGSRRAVPWVQLFEPQLNFSLEEDLATHSFHLRNKRPKPGEPAAYVPTESAGGLESYADIALLPNLGTGGSVLLLSGITMESSEAAGELVAGKGFSAQLARMLGPQAVRDRYFEIVLETRAVAGATRSSQIVAYRLIQPVATGTPSP
jgi:hypothetical protein